MRARTRRPFQVVLVDEIEKAHREVCNVLLQVCVCVRARACVRVCTHVCVCVCTRACAGVRVRAYV